MAHNAINRARWRSVMAMQSFVNDVTHFNITGHNTLRATTAINQFMNIERYFNENQSLGTKLWKSLFDEGGFFSNHGYQDPGDLYSTHVKELLDLIQTVLTNNAICRQQLQARIDDSQGRNGITEQQFSSGPYEKSKNLCFDAIEDIRAINLTFLDFANDNVGAAEQASRSIEEVLYFNSADISPFTAILDRLLTEENIITNANHAQNLRDTLNDWMMFFEIPIQQRLDLFGAILTHDINSDQVIATLQDNIRGYAMNSRTILNNPQTGLNTAEVMELTIDGINPYHEAWGLMQKAIQRGIMNPTDPDPDTDETQTLRPKTALYCSLICFLTSGSSIAVRKTLLTRHFEELISSTQNGIGFVPIVDGNTPVQAPPAAVDRFARFKKHMVKITSLPQSLLSVTPANHFRKNLSECFETMFPSIIPGGNPNANLQERITTLEEFQYEEWDHTNFSQNNSESSDGSSDESSDSDIDMGGGRRKRRKRTRRNRKRKRKKTKRKKRKKTRRKSKRRRKKRRKTRRRK